MSTNQNLYDTLYPEFHNSLKNLDAVLTKATTWAQENPDSLSPTDLPSTRLHPDMLPLSFQVQMVSNLAKFFVHRVGGLPNQVFEDKETTVADLHARVSATLTYIEKAQRADFDRPEVFNQPIELGGQSQLKFTSPFEYATQFVVPNFYFHFSIAYAILRAKGVPLGKMDFLAGGLKTYAGKVRSE